MTINEYQSLALRTANPSGENLSNIGLGIAGEAGEAADLIKKHLHQGHDLDKNHLAKEFGDVAWYIAVGCYIIGYDLETVLKMNIDKLKERYPDGFDSEHSIDRKTNDI